MLSTCTHTKAQPRFSAPLFVCIMLHPKTHPMENYFPPARGVVCTVCAFFPHQQCLWDLQESKFSPYRKDGKRQRSTSSLTIRLHGQVAALSGINPSYHDLENIIMAQADFEAGVLSAWMGSVNGMNCCEGVHVLIREHASSWRCKSFVSPRKTCRFLWRSMQNVSCSTVKTLIYLKKARYPQKSRVVLKLGMSFFKLHTNQNK